jgi:OmpA-OmpF porin, OOP family
MKLVSTICLSICLIVLSASAPAQILDVRRAVKNKVVNRVNNQIDKAIDKEIDKVEKAVVDSITKNASNSESAKENSGQDSGSDSNGNTAASKGNSAQPGAQSGQQSLQTYSKYDFTPGEKVIFFDDFSQDEIGDFPALWNTNASGEVVTTNLFPGKWAKFMEEGFYIPETKGDFPDNFTVEFDWITSVSEDRPSLDLGFYIVSGNLKDPLEGGAIPGVAGNKITLDKFSVNYHNYADGDYIMNGSKELELTENTLYHLAFWVQKQRLRMYINETKVYDIPRGMPEGYKYNMLRFEMGEESIPLITNFRVAAGLPDMRNKLLTDGKLVTYGIYFDTNSDKVKPESYGTLKGIATVLNENPAVKVKIFGHTDSDGNDAANLDLSKRRANAVKVELSKNFAVDASRIETDGKGETAPVAANDNPTNKALNRRVEFIKL